MNRVRVLLADDHPEIRELVVRVLGQPFEIVEIVNDGVAAVETAQQSRPDVLVLDITMPRLNGFEVATRLREMKSDVKIVFLTVHDGPDYVSAGLATGAFGYVAKARLASDLPAAMHDALAGRVFISPGLSPKSET